MAGQILKMSKRYFEQKHENMMSYFKTSGTPCRVDIKQLQVNMTYLIENFYLLKQEIGEKKMVI